MDTIESPHKNNDIRDLIDSDADDAQRSTNSPVDAENSDVAPVNIVWPESWAALSEVPQDAVITEPALGTLAEEATEPTSTLDVATDSQVGKNRIAEQSQTTEESVALDETDYQEDFTITE